MTVTCPDCFTPFAIPDGAAGRRLRCKRCGEVFRADPESAAPPPVAAPRRSRRRARPAGPPVSGAAVKAAAAAVVVAAILGGGLWLYLNADAVKAKATALAEASGAVESEADRLDREDRRRASERWEAGTGAERSPRFANDSPSYNPRFSGPNEPPPKNARREREAGERSVSRIEAIARGEMRHSGTATFTVDGVRRTFATGPSVGGNGFGGPPLSEVPAEPAVGVRVRRARWEGFAALGGLELLADRADADDVLPGESAAAAPAGYVFGGLDAAVGYYVYAVRPLWVPAGGPLDGSAEVREGPWLGEPGNWPVARLRPDGRRLAGVTGRQGVLLDGVNLLFAGGSAAPGDPGPGEAASADRAGSP